MITIYDIKLRQKRNKKNFIKGELRGLSTDAKPIVFEGKYIDNGSIFIEINTGKIFMFDLENEQWKEV